MHLSRAFVKLNEIRKNLLEKIGQDSNLGSLKYEAGALLDELPVKY